jgi:hypothetical protein
MEQRIVLEDEAHFTVAERGSRRCRESEYDRWIDFQPAIIRSSVVFPEPDGPSSATICPEGISSEISFSTWCDQKIS